MSWVETDIENQNALRLESGVAQGKQAQEGNAVCLI
jgi:hypothetical protein